jgi:hypothetical protein
LAVISEGLAELICCLSLFFLFLIYRPPVALYPVFQSAAGWEEYFDYIFPDDDTSQSNLKLLEMAQLWKKRKAQQE